METVHCACNDPKCHIQLCYQLSRSKMHEEKVTYQCLRMCNYMYMQNNNAKVIYLTNND